MRAEGKFRKWGAVVRRAQITVWVGVILGAVLASSSAGQGPPPGAGQPGGAPPGLAQAIEAKQKHADKLLDKPGVVGVAVALNPAGKPVVRIYKEQDDVDDLPSSLDGVDVDTVTTGRIEPYDHLPTHRYPRPVPIGVSSGLAGVATGTIGVRVTDGTNTYALSNNHVFAGVNTASIGEPIISPGDADGGSDPADRIGTLAAYQTINFDGGTNTMDAALALTSPANVGTATPADGYGAPSPSTTAAVLDQPVQKYGRTTGFQLGTVVGTNIAVDVCYIALFELCLQEARFDGQISVSPGPFAAPGDSGSLIVEQGSNRPVALLFAGGDGLTIGSPIDLVLQRFGVTIEGQPSGPGPPSAPTSLVATGGDGAVSLSWGAPAFDGGSAIANYNVYRGTAPGQLSLYADDIGTSTTFVDPGVANGTTYYYTVSAENASGEGAQSNEASATPSELISPDPLFVLDDFNRPNENPLLDAGRWSNGVVGSAETGLNVNANQLACNRTTTCTGWRNTAQLGPDAESWARISVLPGTGNSLRLYVRLTSAGTGGSGYELRTIQQTGTDQVLLERIDAGVLVTRLTINQELAAGDTMLLRAKGSTIEAWRNDGSTWARLGLIIDTTHTAAGFVGVGLRGTTGRADDFGGRTLAGGQPDTQPPGPPVNLTAVAMTTGRIDLDWGIASDNSGIARYRVERCQGAGCASFAEIATTSGVVTDYSDTSLDPATQYSYRVRAEDVATPPNVGPYSGTATATTLENPVSPDPLFTLDDFNRANESPLSDAGRWSNGVVGSTETGLHVNANQLACNRTTTCTAWRNTAQLGPDAESWARISVLPGTSNSLRLYVRLTGAGAGGSGYMLRTIQQTGTDQVLLERIDAGVLVTRLTVNQELSAGDTLLLRAKGSNIEAWRLAGASWTRLGLVIDTTHPAAGFAGVGLRGTTGRADDFGSRTMGAPPPDTEAPSAPGTLIATPFSTSQIELDWGPATDNVAVTTYRIERCEGAGCSNFAEIALGTSTSHMDVGLNPSTSYSYRVRAADAVPNVGPYGNTATAVTLTPPDTEAPSAPGALSATPFSTSRIDLTWGAATDNVGVTLYRVESCTGTGCSDFVEIAATAGTSFEHAGLSASTSYSYRVRAEDAVPNLGEYGDTASATTPTPPDTEAPSAPGTLTAVAESTSRIDLAWGPATDNVAVSLYRIERCSGAGCVDFTEIGTTAGTTFQSTDLSASTSYSYRVRAEDAVPNLGEYGNTASATTPSLVVPPLEPLPTIDSFNRRNENPLSDLERWSNGVNGAGETGLRVTSNALACGKTTTCTAWRNNAMFGPDTEVWARLTTLPGANNGIRLLARLQQPGLATYSGYMLRTTQLTGTDQVLLERVDPGAITTRLTISQELAAGDTLLLRVQGSTLEAWLKRGTSWTRLGGVVDGTYSQAGRVGVGIRGKTGRLDDFGAR